MTVELEYVVIPLSEEDEAWWGFDAGVLVELAEGYRKEIWKEWLVWSEER